jgi:diguanylate cyclase (GGDEF)-like protein/PAS domain S-box-containing protein
MQANSNDTIWAHAAARYATVCDHALLLVHPGPDDHPQVMWANEAAARLWHLDLRQLLGTQIDMLLVSTDTGDATASKQLCTNTTTHADMTARRVDGFMIQVAASSYPGADGWMIQVDVRDDHLLHTQLEISRQRLSALATSSPIPTMLSDVGVRLGYVNPAMAALLQCDTAELLGVGWLDFVRPDHRSQVLDAIQQVLSGHDTDVRVEMVDKQVCTHPVHIRLAPAASAAQGAGFVGTIEDMTDRIAHEHALTKQATHDPLTNLPNREWMLTELRQRVDTNDPLAVLFIDLDDFKMVNDSMGHDAGDQLLAVVGQRLARAVREGDYVARFGGDEFVVLAPGIRTAGQASRLANRLLQALGQPIETDLGSIHPTGSIGVAIRNQHHGRARDLVRDADAAMYVAKRAGRNRFQICDESISTEAARALSLVADLRQAVDGGQLQAWFQPIWDGDGREMQGVEALARWWHPQFGQIPPEQFVALAERFQLIGPLTDRMLDLSLAQLTRWDANGPLVQRVAVNVSPKHLCDQSMVKMVMDRLERHGIEPYRLCLEVTESSLARSVGAASKTMNKLRREGVCLSIDDFGTGYSSLSQLWNLPVDQIKIDRSFVMRLGKDRSAPIVCKAIVDLAHGLNLQVVAEGIETEQQLQTLRDMGVDMTQGWLLARPSPGNQVGRNTQSVVTCQV